ncbi:MAG: hypothetical protein ACE5ID_03260 [Acidobacteriota bacterium]
MTQTESSIREEKDRSAGKRLDKAIQETRERVSRAVDTAKEKVMGIVDEAKTGVETVKEKIDVLKEKKTGDLVDDTKDLIQKHPGAAVVLSVSAGFMLGWLLKGRD